MAAVVMYSTQFCGYCVRAKMLLEKLGIPFEEIDVSGNVEKRRWLVSTTGQRTVPQIFIRDESIGGFDELYALHRSGELEQKLTAA